MALYRYCSVAAAATLALAGCGTVYEDGLAFANGWRSGQVVRVMGHQSIAKPGYWSCLRRKAPHQRRADRYAEVAYRQFGRTRHHLVPLPAAAGLAAGDKVHVNVGTCDATLRTRS